MFNMVRKGELLEKKENYSKSILTTAMVTDKGEDIIFESVLTLTHIHGPYYGVYEDGYNFIQEKDFAFEEVMHIKEIKAKYRKYRIAL